MISACAKGQAVLGEKNMDMAVRAEEFIRTALVERTPAGDTGTGKPPGGKAG